MQQSKEKMMNMHQEEGESFVVHHVGAFKIKLMDELLDVVICRILISFLNPSSGIVYRIKILASLS